MKFKVGTEVVINDNAPANRDDIVTFVYDMERQLGKRGKITRCSERRSTYVYKIKTEDGETWWYMDITSTSRIHFRRQCWYLHAVNTLHRKNEQSRKLSRYYQYRIIRCN